MLDNFHSTGTGKKKLYDGELPFSTMSPIPVRSARANEVVPVSLVVEEFEIP
jgi:hypothetical protein